MFHNAKVQIIFNLQIYVTYLIPISYKIEKSRNLLIINEIR